MLKPNEVLEGVTRSELVKAAAEQTVAAASLALLWRIVDAGFLAFAPKAQKAFREHDPCVVFTMDELRSIFNFLENHIALQMRQQGLARDEPHRLPQLYPDAPEPDWPADYTLESSRLIH